MATREESVQNLRNRVEKLRHEVERLKAVKACINAGNKYQTYHQRRMITEHALLFALKTPGACVEMLWGIYDEPEGVIRWKFAEGFGKLPGKFQGSIGSGHAICTPIVEVAQDGKTAKGLWLMFAYYGTEWAAGQFAFDFIKEDGEWKLWKYNTTGLIFSPYEKGWHIHNAPPPRMQGRGVGEGWGDYRIDRPASYAFAWSPDEYFQNIPPIPVPYETWDDSLACIPVPGREWQFEKFE